MANDTTTQTLRESARQAIIDEVQQAAKYSHHRNYHRLHIRRDGSINWSESINRSDDIIDGQAGHFAAVRSVTVQGTGSYGCDCDHCSDEGYDTRDDAITDAVCESDLSGLEAAMLEEFDAIPAGYFDDERGPRRITETRRYSFYGTNRHNLPGVHPSERMSESEEFSEDVMATYDADGEIAEVESIPESVEALYSAVRDRAKALLAAWPDQEGIRIHEYGASSDDDTYEYRLEAR